MAFQHALDFDRDLPHYGTRHGVLPSNDPLVRHSPPLMWAEALDRLMGMVARESGLDLSRLRAISGSAQQHGSVYLNAAAGTTLNGLNHAQPLAPQIKHVFSRSTSPIWMDASTGAECAAITKAVGGAEALARLTGSRAFERFTGPQIRKFAEHDPAAYQATHRIHLVSSFLGSLLAGGDAPIEPGDGSGMNLMDLSTEDWAPRAVEATAPGLAAKLPPISPSWTVVGALASYWRERYGFPAARIVAWTGDNPSSLVGLGLARTGTLAISLGTSDTLFGPMQQSGFDPTGSGHVFGSPTGGYMGLICCRNGSLARERVRDAYGLDWKGFAAALAATPAGNNGAMMLPWFEPEITPPVSVAGVRRSDLNDADGPANVRAVVEAQMTALAIHSAWMGVAPTTIRATGGAAVNDAILHVMADVFNATVERVAVENSACLGAALRAWHADRKANGEEMSWDDVMAGFTDALAKRTEPVPANVARYTTFRKEYTAFESRSLP